MASGTSESSHSPGSQHEGSSHGHRSPGSALPSTTTHAEKRVPLACHRCRTKRARCSGNRPVCQACAKASEECVWPEGRKRKRTRREMEADERMATNPHTTGTSDVQIVQETGFGRGQVAWAPINDQPTSTVTTSAWPYPASRYPSYIWPPAQPSIPSQSLPVSPVSPVHVSRVTEKPLSNELAYLNGNTPQIAKVLDSQVAFIEGDPTRQEELELYYYRISGSTAVNPGINRISLKLLPRSSTCDSKPSAPISMTSTPPSQSTPPNMFDENGSPNANIYLPLFDTFFRTVSRHFPSISRKRMEERLETGTMSAFLLNCICAIAARFHNPSSICPAKDAAPFITKAQELIIPLLHLPAHDSVTGLLLLAWANYGQNSDSGLWQYSGMAIRMAMDLGVHEVSELYESEAHVVRTRLLFWSLFVTDRIVAFSTGRPVSISEEIIELPLPVDEDLTPDPARTNEATACHEQVQSNAFTYLVRLMVLCGRIGNVLNGRRGKSRTLVGPGLASPTLLLDLQKQLAQFYSQLPGPMKWTVEAFRHQEARGHGGVFLTLHLWANSVLALVYHPELIANPSGFDTPMSASVDRSVKLSLASSRLISECLVFADLFASQSYLASPMAVQPIFVACLAFIHDIKLGMVEYQPLQPPTEAPGTADLLLTSLARQNLSVLVKAMQRIAHYWGGVSFVLSTLQQKITNAGLTMPELDTSRTSAIKTFISLPDKGLLRRFTEKDLPHDTAPPTDTSLRLSKMRESSSSPGNYAYSVDDLMSMYSVEGMFVQPADPFDLESLLSSTMYKQNGIVSDMNGFINPGPLSA